MNDLLDMYKRLGGTEEELVMGMKRVSRQVASDVSFLEVWAEYKNEWHRLINGSGHATVTMRDIARTLGYNFPGAG